MDFWSDYDNRVAQRQKQPQQTIQQPQQPGGIVGFLQGVGKSVGQSYGNLGTSIANALQFGDFQKQADQTFKNNQQDIQTIKNLGQRLKSATSEDEKARIRKAIAASANTSDLQNIGSRANEIVQQNDPTKRAADVGSIGLDVLGAGAGSQLLKGGLRQAIAGGAKQGALFGGAQGALQPLQEKGAGATAEDIGSGAAVGAGMGGLLGGVTGGVLRGGEKILSKGARNAAVQAAETPGILSRTTNKSGQKLEKVGQKLLASQSNITDSQARQFRLNPAKTFGSINQRTGLTSLDDMAQVGQRLTGGKDSILDTATRAVLGEGKGVDVGDLRKIADEKLQSGASLLTPTERKQLLDNMTQAGVIMRGGAKGSLSEMADMSKALDQANAFRSAARDLKKGISPSPGSAQMARVYDDMAQHIEDSLYKTPGVDEALPSIKRAASNDLRIMGQEAEQSGNKAQANAFASIANEVDNVKSVSDLRKLKKDFVDISKIDEITGRREGQAGAQLGGTMQGLGRLVQNPLNAVALPLNAATPQVAGVIAKGGRGLLARANRDAATKAIQEASNPEVRQVAETAVGAATTPTIARGASQMNQPEQPQPIVEQPLFDESQTSDVVPTDTTDQSSQINAALQQAALEALANGDTKALANIKTVMDLFAPSKGTTLSAAQKNALIKANSASSILDSFEQQLQGKLSDNGPEARIRGVLAGITAPAGLDQEAKVYNDLRQGLTTQLAKALGESGSLSDQDVQRAMSLVPTLGDTKQEAAAKIAQIRSIIGGISNSTMNIGQ